MGIFAGSVSGVILQVCRLVSGTKYKLIGQNTVTSSMKGQIKVVKVALKDQFKVKKDDYISWVFIDKAAFGFSSSQGTTRWSTGNGVAYKKVGGKFSFPGTSRRVYQCRAYVSSSSSSFSFSSSSSSVTVTHSSMIVINRTFAVNRTFV